MALEIRDLLEVNARIICLLRKKELGIEQEQTGETQSISNQLIQATREEYRKQT